MQIRGLILLALFCTALISGCGGGGGESAPMPVVETETLNGAVNMPTGFQVIGSNGQAQIDGSFVNLALVAKGTVTIPAGGTFVDGYEALASITPQISINGVTPILCIAPQTMNVAIGMVQKSGNTFQYTLVAGASNAAETFKWFVFDSLTLIPPSRYGLQVFNGSGVLVFDAASQPMRVAGVAQLPNAPLIGNPGRINARGGAGTYAFCLSQGRVQSTWAAPYTTIFTDGGKIDSTGASTKNIVLFSIQANKPVSSTQAGQIMLVDVSGL